MNPHCEERLEHFQRLERLQNRRAEIAIRLLRELQKNPNLLSGRRRVRHFLRHHWEVLQHDPASTDIHGEGTL
jgi:hypothetical protein